MVATMSQTELGSTAPRSVDPDQSPALASRARWELDSRPADVLVFGSRLVYGSVGTNAALPPLEAAGLRVAAVPTALLSNLPHHPSFQAMAIPPDWLGATLHDLSGLKVADDVATVCTGYFADPKQVEIVGRWLSALVARRPHLRVIVDPTLGDHDVGTYTDPLVADALTEHLLPLATGLTPNRFELELLQRSSATGNGDSQTLLAQARQLLRDRTEWVIVTGGSADKTMKHVSATIVTANHDVVLTEEYVPTGVKGAGDVFVGALIAELHRGAAVTNAVIGAADQVRRALSTRSLGPLPSPLHASLPDTSGQ